MKTPEELTVALKSNLGDKLESVVLYGSAAADNQTKEYSDFNIFVLLSDMNLETLKSIMPIAKKWSKAGNPPPLLFTEKRMEQSKDVFPMEFLDIKDAHRLLYGKDPFVGLNLRNDNLRHQLEYELRGKLIQLRERYLQTDGKKKAVFDLMARSLSTFTALFRGLLRLVGDEVPLQRLDVWEKCAKHVSIEPQIFKKVDGLRDGMKSGDMEAADALFQEYLMSIEKTVEFVDKFKGGVK